LYRAGKQPPEGGTPNLSKEANMFCSGCGYENLQGVNYCKQCGVKLNSAPSKSFSPWLAGIFLVVIAFITLTGFMIPVMMLAELSGKGFDNDSLLAMSFFFLLSTVIIDGFLIHLLTRLLGLSKQAKQEAKLVVTTQPKYQTSEQQYQQLPEPPSSMPSVTEHTTRNFDPMISREQRNRETS
jgi:hypothetical protein